jgi:hypothetical protein
LPINTFYFAFFQLATKYGHKTSVHTFAAAAAAADDDDDGDNNSNDANLKKNSCFPD